LLQPPHGFLNFFAAQLLDRRVMRLIEIDVVGAQAPQRSVDGLEDVLLREVLLQCGAGIAHDANLRGDDDVLPFPRQHDAEERLAAAEAIAVRHVEKRDAEVAPAADRGGRLIIVRLPPPERRSGSLRRAPDGPAAEADLADANPRVAERPILHLAILQTDEA